MKKWVSRAGQFLFSPNQELRIQLFNILAAAGVTVSLVSAIVSTLMGEKRQNAIVYLIFALLSAGLIWYSSKSGRYQRCYLITIVTIFLFGFSFFFFNNGGYYGTIPYFFVFALVFTAFMLEGKMAILMVGAELLTYIGQCLYAYYFFIPDDFYISSRTVMITTVFGFVVVGLALSIVMLLQFRLYNQQREKLNEQNDILKSVSHAKTEFLANTSHEMRTPLTVVSVNIQMVMGLLRRMEGFSKDLEAGALLADAQAEIMRLSRMVDGMLMLNTASGTSEVMEKKRLDLSALLHSVKDVMRLVLNRNSNELQSEISEVLIVFGNADLLTQVIMNLMDNANKHTQNGVIRLCGEATVGAVTVTVSDNGIGILPELLPHVFERGVTKGGTGLGLSFCKMVVESHGGTIRIASEPGKGTDAIITLPVYQGQFGGNEK